ncbi:MAG: sulfur carrier protein ThiS [Alphaproteobacteria bacterium]
MITINGEQKPLGNGRSIADVLEENGYGGKLVAVARNGEFVPRTLHANTNLEVGDELEIVAPMQGG